LAEFPRHALQRFFFVDARFGLETSDAAAMLSSLPSSRCWIGQNFHQQRDLAAHAIA